MSFDASKETSAFSFDVPIVTIGTVTLGLSTVTIDFSCCYWWPLILFVLVFKDKNEFHFDFALYSAIAFFYSLLCSLRMLLKPFLSKGLGVSTYLVIAFGEKKEDVLDALVAMLINSSADGIKN